MAKTPTPQLWRRQFTKAKPGQIPFQTHADTSTVLFASTWQIGAVFSGPSAVAIGALAPGARATVTQTIVLTQSLPGAVATGQGVLGGVTGSVQRVIFPQTITLGVNQTAIVVATVTAGTLVDIFGNATSIGSLPIIGLPQVGITFSIGQPGAGLVQAGALAQLNGPGTWSAPSVTVTLPLYAPGATGAATLALNVSAVLYGQQN